MLYQLEPSPLTITTDAAADKVQVTANTVAFLSGGFDSGILRIGTDADTVYTLDDSPATSATSTAQGSLASYAAHVKTQIEAQGYDTDCTHQTQCSSAPSSRPDSMTYPTPNCSA
ncbi:hypothetical protein [endosymbiont of Riftia pachyptila]|uniref:Uncharacterized protein n=1 Tax=endosymbiont of Riftia pachyptila (vent Ph05) TaxID=1048808 RepID=G2DGN0_9GAMM|nr:hypothetical protein [endosymbiont of Riftia pachyptila]EGV50220.1 hypothetical protein Rifp1Sym_ds00050 [endosymbiont of Riftia pachyptila (vent Ph05)]